MSALPEPITDPEIKFTGIFINNEWEHSGIWLFPIIMIVIFVFYNHTYVQLCI